MVARGDDRVAAGHYVMGGGALPVEGQVNQLKMLKRQMFGRASLRVLRARIVPAAKVG
jgi:transposase